MRRSFSHLIRSLGIVAKPKDIAIRVSWYSLVRNGKIHHWYHSSCYQAKGTPRYQEQVQEVEVNKLKKDVLCVGCKGWICAPQSNRTIALPVVRASKRVLKKKVEK